MPFHKRIVQPIHLSQVQVPNDVPNELECVANHTLANIIRQLSSLSAHAQDTFDELMADASHIFQRSEALHGRIERLRVKVAQLDSNADEATIQDVNNRKPFVSVTRVDQQVVNRATMPYSMRLLYEQAEPAPALHLLNPYRDDGRDSTTFYTDPQFFFNLWMQSMIQFPAAQHQYRGGKNERHRSPKETNSNYQESIYASNPTSSSQARLIKQVSDEQKYVHCHRPEYGEIVRSQVPIYSPTGRHSLPQYPDSDLIKYGSPTLSSGSSSREHQSMTMHFSSIGTPLSPTNALQSDGSPRLDFNSPLVTRQAPPPPSQLASTSMIQSEIHSLPKSTMSRPSASPPPPPPPLPPQSVPIPILATISEIDNLPPPPEDFIEHINMSKIPPPPPAPPMPSNIPAAPPLPNSTLQSLVMRPSKGVPLPIQRDDVSVTSETSIQDQRPYIMRDLRSDLLEQIKKGIQLNHRKKEEEKKASVTTKTSSLNVMAIMEQAAKYRRDKIRPQSESENDDESSRWDDSD